VACDVKDGFRRFLHSESAAQHGRRLPHFSIMGQLRIDPACAPNRRNRILLQHPHYA
jgi:hypothetical protein